MKKALISETEYPSSPQGLHDFFNDIKNSGFADLSYKHETEEYQKKQQLYSEGYRPRFLFYLNKGKVKTYKLLKKGRSI